jgi:hypothetical protein
MNITSPIHAAWATLCAALLLTACGRNQPEPEASVVIPAEPFSISLVPAADLDSASRTALLYVAVDDHFNPHTDTLEGDLARAWRLDSLRPDAEGRYHLEGTSHDVAEVHLTTPSGSLRTLFAAGGGDYTWTYSKTDITAEDSLNGWMQRSLTDLQARTPDSCRLALDSLCLADAGSIRATLLIRELLPTVRDTLFLRRCLGHLSPEAKPAWLMYDIDQRMDERYRSEFSGLLKRNFTFTDSKGQTFNFSNLYRTDQLVYFWADYDAASVSALQRLEAKCRKAKLVTFCLHAADSATWRRQVSGLPGSNVLLRDGLNHPMLRAWGVDRPGLYMLLNASARVLYRGTDEKQLAHSLDSLPQPREERKLMQVR